MNEPTQLDDVIDSIGQRITTPEHVQAAAQAARLDKAREYRQRVAMCESCLQVNLGKRYSECTLAGFEQYHPNQVSVLKAIGEIAGEIDEFVAAGRGLILYGPCGTGKDHLATVLLRRAAGVGLSSRWVNGRAMYADIKDAYGSETTQHYLRLPYIAPDVLCISDPALPSGISKDNADNLYLLINERDRQCRSTWITLNVDTPGRAREVLTAQVYSRLRMGTVELFCNWPDYRERKKT